jgi:hypothetical protein
MTSMLLRASLCVLASGSCAQAQCALLVKETFRHGERMHGGNGRLRDVNIHSNLDDYWPEIPEGSRWIANDGGGPTWTFASSSVDPAEVDALDEFNGTAFGEPGATALVAFTPEPGAFTVSAEAVMLYDSTSATRLGFSSTSVTTENFATDGALWMSLNGRGEWTINANGSQLIASGVAPVVGTLDSGWLHMEFTYDPDAGTVSGRVMNTVIPATPVTLTRNTRYVGIESYESWNAVNNLIVRNGGDPIVTVSGPESACTGGSVTFTASSNTGGPGSVYWLHEYGWPLVDGPRADGSIVSGASTMQLTISNLAASEMGVYSCQVVNQCGLSGLWPVAFTVSTCNPCPADFNQDGGVDGSDVADFFASWETGNEGADTNADGGVDGGDIETFFAAWEAGGC